MYQDWAFGLLILKVWTRLLLNGKLDSSARARALKAEFERFNAAGRHDFELLRSLTHLMFPILGQVLVVLIVPFTLVRFCVLPAMQRLGMEHVLDPVVATSHSAQERASPDRATDAGMTATEIAIRQRLLDNLLAPDEQCEVQASPFIAAAREWEPQSCSRRMWLLHLILDHWAMDVRPSTASKQPAQAHSSAARPTAAPAPLSERHGPSASSEVAAPSLHARRVAAVMRMVHRSRMALREWRQALYNSVLYRNCFALFLLLRLSGWVWVALCSCYALWQRRFVDDRFLVRKRLINARDPVPVLTQT